MQVGLAEIGEIIDSVRQGIKYVVASEGQLKDAFANKETNFRCPHMLE